MVGAETSSFGCRLASVCESALELGLVKVSSLGWGFGFRVWASGLASVCQVALGARVSGAWSRVGVGV